MRGIRTQLGGTPYVLQAASGLYGVMAPPTAFGTTATSFLLSADTGHYSLTGEPATLNYSGAASNYLIYSNGVMDSVNFTKAIAASLSFSVTLDYNNTTQVQPGHTYSLQCATTSNFGGGWQPGSNWSVIPPNGFDASPYTWVQAAVWTPAPINMHAYAYFTRSTGNDIAVPTAATEGATEWSISANTWTTVRIPFADLGRLGAYNFYKFSIGTNGNHLTYYLDDVQFLAGNLGWVFQGTGAPAAGWTDASTATADYTWLPQTLSGTMYSLNNPRQASEFIGSASGTALTVTSIVSGSIQIGDLFVSNPSSTPVASIQSGSGLNWVLSASVGTISSRHLASAPGQSVMTGVKLTAAAINGTLKLTHSGFSISPFTYLTFAAIPTKAGYGYEARLYDTSGVAIGNAVTAAGYTCFQYGVSTVKWTVYNIPITAFGTLGTSTIGGVSIRETSSNGTNVTYFSAIGFFS